VSAVHEFDVEEITAVGRRVLPVDEDAAPYLPPLIPEADYGELSKSAEWFRCGMPGCM
jgi:hypothetical protein